MKEIPAACKFCASPVLLLIHEDALEMLTLKYWVPLAACNRCADYHTKRLRIVRAVQWCSNNFMLADNAKPEVADEIRRDTKSKINELTKKLANNAAAHYSAPYTWEPDWVVQLTEQPGNATLSCQFYERTMWKDWNRRKQSS